MNLLVQPPVTIRVTEAGLTNLLLPILVPGFAYKIYAIQFVSAKSTRDLTLLEDGFERWRGTVKQGASLRVDFGNPGWDLVKGNGLDIVTSGKLVLDVNILQWGILKVGT